MTRKYYPVITIESKNNFMAQPPEKLEPHSYERFARLPFNRKIDETLLAMAQGRFKSHTDLATGSGAIIGHCLRLGEYEGETWSATGVDIDPEGLAIAQARFASFEIIFDLSKVVSNKKYQE